MNWELGGYCLLRLLMATLLGVAIGYERKLRFKEAGIRTHSIVALGACLMMLISIYAFDDNADKARVAAQIVSGVGFLGAGMIMFKQQSGIHGLTTAAGIWLTAGVGMAVGGGMYILSVGATVLIILIQCIFHLPFKVFKTKKYVQLKLLFENNDVNNAKIKEIFSVKQFTKLKAVKEDNIVMFSAVLTTDIIFEDTYIGKVLEENNFIKSIERIDND